MYSIPEEMTMDVSCCKECPFIICARDTENEYCAHPLIQPSKFNAFIGNSSVTPAWCPLIQYSVIVKLKK